jgi:hypothetical protein
MAYSDFTLDRARKELGLVLQTADLFGALAAVEPPAWLLATLQGYRGLPLVSEKARGELLVMPVLAAGREMSQNVVTIFSGQTLNVDPEAGLVGECDFIVARTPPVPVLSAPVLTVVEAKKGDEEQGLGQCAAQMVGARRFNEAEGQTNRPVFGCVTTGEDWQFLKLEGGQLAIDHRRYYIDNLGLILAVLLAVVAASAS